jgi:hypothetical protein
MPRTAQDCRHRKEGNRNAFLRWSQIKFHLWSSECAPAAGRSKRPDDDDTASKYCSGDREKRVNGHRRTWFPATPAGGIADIH